MYGKRIGGYKMIELKDTIDDMKSDDYKRRFRAEYQQLKIRTIKLNSMLEKYEKGTLNFKPSCSYAVLHEQFVHMNDYLNSLTKRAIIESIDVEWLNEGIKYNK